MRWKVRHRSECYPGVEPKTKSLERYLRLLLIAVIAILSVLSLMYVSRARASVIPQIDPTFGSTSHHLTARRLP